MRTLAVKFAAVFTGLALTISGLVVSPANATGTQGGTEGLLFISDASAGTVWQGNISNPNGPKHSFWTNATSDVDQVAVTATRVAWTSAYPESGSVLENKVLIADVARTAGTITTVSFDSPVMALGCDPEGERYYAIENGKLWTFKSDGTGKTMILENDTLGAVLWGLAIDPVRHKLYYGNFDEGAVYQMDLGVTNTTYEDQRQLYTDQGGIDGVAIDPVSNTLFWSSFDAPALASGPAVDGGTATVLYESMPVDVGNGTENGVAPSGVMVNNAIGKIYITVEQAAIEMNFDGTGQRIMYTSGVVSNGFETLGVAWGSWNFSDPAPTIASISPDSGPVAGGTTVTITGTDFLEGAVVLVGGQPCTVQSLTSTQIVCVTSAHAKGLVNVKVTNPDDQNDVLSGGYVYLAEDVEPQAAGKHFVQKRVFFGSMSPKVHTKAKAVLKALAESIPAGATNVRINVTGYVQNVAATNNDVSLSRSRAKNVAKELKKAGLTGKYIVRGAGKSSEPGKISRRVVVGISYYIEMPR